MFPIKVVDKIKIYFIQKLFFENRDVYEIMWKTFVDPDRTQMTI